MGGSGIMYRRSRPLAARPVDRACHWRAGMSIERMWTTPLRFIARIYLFAANWNAGASPFAWVKTADQILAKAVRKRPAISESRH